MEILAILAVVLGIIFIIKYYFKDSVAINSNYDLDKYTEKDTEDEEKNDTFADDMFSDKKGIAFMVALFIIIIVAIVSVYIGGI